MEISRRDLFRGGRDAGSLLAISSLLRELGLPPVAAASASEAGLSTGADVDMGEYLAATWRAKRSSV
jgi:hypothetical protein